MGLREALEEEHMVRTYWDMLDHARAAYKVGLKIANAALNAEAMHKSIADADYSQYPEWQKVYDMRAVDGMLTHYIITLIGERHA